MKLGNMLLSKVHEKRDIERSIERIRNSYSPNRMLESIPEGNPTARCENGTFVGKIVDNVAEYKGIPFAKAPVGPLRWKRPEAPDSDSGIYEAFHNGKSPIQTEWETERASYYRQGEDCLCLNIWTGASDGPKDKTVMVFFHGGSYGWGGTADPLYDGRAFASLHPDVVLVTAAYRIGIMGFIDFSEVPGGEDFRDAPNLGLLDQIEALRWIKKNIRSFGGDPDNVTVFGESAGGGSVSLLPIISEAKGLFRRVIAESGSVALTFSKEECLPFTRKFLAESGAKNMNDLMALTEKEIMQINEKLNMYNNFPERDGIIIPTDPYLAYDKGISADIDMMIGTNANEMNYWVGEVGGIIPYRFGIPVKFENDLKILSRSDKKALETFMNNHHGHSIWRMSEYYNEIMFRLPAIRQAESHSRNGGKVYMYYWTKPSAIKYRGACHAVELSYVFGNIDETIYTGERSDPELAELVMQMWVNFAKTGNPSVGDLVWAPYSENDRATMVLEEEPHLQRDVLEDQRRLLMPITRHMINASYAEIDYNVPFTRRAILFGTLAAGALIAGGVLLVRSILKGTGK